jgi:uncharacterized membrane protein YgdD (TMEM256/DUF423 family)
LIDIAIPFRSLMLLVAAGILGAAGVAAAAAGAHVTGGALSSAAGIMLVHAAALLGVVAFGVAARGEKPSTDAAGALLFLGAALFGADIAMRAFLGTPLFPLAAPTGGVVMIAGWLGLAVSALLKR